MVELISILLVKVAGVCRRIVAFKRMQLEVVSGCLQSFKFWYDIQLVLLYFKVVVVNLVEYCWGSNYIIVDLEVNRVHINLDSYLVVLMAVHLGVHH